LNESEYPMELIKLSCLTSFFFFELKVRKKSIARQQGFSRRRASLSNHESQKGL